MRTNLVLTVTSVAAMLVTGGTAAAQAPTGIISVTSGYKAGPPITAQPSGDFTVTKSKAGDEYRVLVDYGTFTDSGAFTVWTGPAVYEVGIVTGIGQSIYTWGPTAVTTLTNPPQGLKVRARLEWRPANNVAWTQLHQSITSCP